MVSNARYGKNNWLHGLELSWRNNEAYWLWKKIQWIKGCIRATKFSVFINGSSRGTIVASRGLRLEDSVSMAILFGKWCPLTNSLKRLVPGVSLKALKLEGMNSCPYFTIFRWHISPLQRWSSSFSFWDNKLNFRWNKKWKITRESKKSSPQNGMHLKIGLQLTSIRPKE